MTKQDDQEDLDRLPIDDPDTNRILEEIELLQIHASSPHAFTARMVRLIHSERERAVREAKLEAATAISNHLSTDKDDHYIDNDLYVWIWEVYAQEYLNERNV